MNSELKKKPRIILMGTPDIAVDSFEAVLKDDFFNVIAVVTQPDKPVGRKQVITSPPVKKLAEKYNIPVLQPQKAKEISFIETIRSLKPDMAFVIAYGHILTQEFLDIFPYGCINMHVSILPKLRGASPIHNAILQGLKTTGITFMKINIGVDSGPILKQFECEVGNKDIFTLYSDLKILGAQHVNQVLKDYLQDKITLIEQNQKEATHCGMIHKEDGSIDIKKDTSEIIMRKYRAYKGWPGIFLETNIGIIKLKNIEISQISKVSNSIFSFYKKVLYLHSSPHTIKINSLQLPGKKEMSAIEFYNGLKNKQLNVEDIDIL